MIEHCGRTYDSANVNKQRLRRISYNFEADKKKVEADKKK